MTDDPIAALRNLPAIEDRAAIAQPPTLTYDMLTIMQACSQKEVFRAYFPDGLPLEERAIYKAQRFGLPLEWVMQRLPEPMYEEFQQGLRQAAADRDRTRKLAEDAYYKAYRFHLVEWGRAHWREITEAISGYSARENQARTDYLAMDHGAVNPAEPALVDRLGNEVAQPSSGYVQNQRAILEAYWRGVEHERSRRWWHRFTKKGMSHYDRANEDQSSSKARATDGTLRPDDRGSRTGELPRGSVLGGSPGSPRNLQEGPQSGLRQAEPDDARGR